MTYRSTIGYAPCLEGVGECLAVGKAMEFLIDAMPGLGVRDIDKPATFGIVNFNKATARKFIKPIIWRSDKKEPPPPDRACVGEPVSLGTFRQAERNLHNCLGAVLIITRSTFCLIEDQHRFIVGESR